MTATIPDADLAILSLEKEQAWEAYEAARTALEASRRVERELRLREVQNRPLFTAFEHIATIVYAWAHAADPAEAARALVLVEEAVKTARRDRQDVVARQKERHG